MATNLKTLLCMVLLSLISTELLAERMVTFWTSERRLGKIQIWVNGFKAGTITKTYKQAPGPDAEGCVTVTLPDRDDNKWSATSANGSVWKDAVINPDTTHYTLRLSTRSQGEKTKLHDVAWQRPGIGMAMAVGIVPLSVLGLTNDLYVMKSMSHGYGGYSFGLRNTLDPHIDIEVGASVVKGGKGWRTPFMDGTLDFDRRVNTWAIDINALYNIFDKCGNLNCGRLVNPYFGFAFSTLIDRNIDHKSAFGGIVGISIGRGLKFHLRYKNMNNFTSGDKVFNQLEAGLSFRIQRRTFFAK